MIHFTFTRYIWVVVVVVAVCAALNPISVIAQAGGVSISETGSTPAASAILDVSSTDKGFLLPRMSSTDRDNIDSPEEGLQIFNITTKCFEAFVSGSWHHTSCPGECQIPGPAGLITGSSVVCAGQSNVTYSITPVANAMGYTWALPPGASISSGSNTSSVTVDFSGAAVSGVIQVSATNSCGTGSTSSNFSVTVTPLPPAAGNITGSASVCQGQNAVSYYVNQVNGATSYNWALPSGASIASGQNTESIVVNYGPAATAGQITVSALNACGSGTSSPAFSVSVNPLVSGSQTFGALGAIATFTVPSCVYSMTVLAKGAQGGNAAPDGVGGRGASIQGTFSVVPGEVYKVLAGGQGVSSTSGQFGAGGGGGSFVWNNATSGLLIAAGGGGGSAFQGSGGSGSGSGYNNGGYGSATITPTAPPTSGSGGSGGTAGSGGNGGAGFTPTFNMPGAGGGAGWVSDGGNGGNGSSATGGIGGKRPLNGGNAGAAGSGFGKDGGFGGGGGGAGIGGGGGGGYNGGGGGTGLSQPTGIVSAGGGGGSYNGGTAQVNNANAQTGDGQVIISW